MAKEQFKKDNAKAYEWLRKARKSCIEYITRVVKEHDNMIRFDFDNNKEILTVMYDGGNYPEYNSNCFSCLYNVHINKNGNLCAEIEESPDYDFDRMNTEEIMTIAEAIHDSVIPRLNDPDYEDPYAVEGED